jgi:hypothetical protein
MTQRRAGLGCHRCNGCIHKKPLTKLDVELLKTQVMTRESIVRLLGGWMHYSEESFAVIANNSLMRVERWREGLVGCSKSWISM